MMKKGLNLKLKSVEDRSRLAVKRLALRIIRFPSCRKAVFAVLDKRTITESRMPSEEARKILEQFSPCPEGNSLLQTARARDNAICALTVIVPVYNTSAWVDACIESILDQHTSFPYSLVLVDDGSTDRSGEIIDRYAHYSNVCVIHQTNQGLSAARNRGIGAATGEYLLFVDSDDRLLPGCIETLLATAQESSADIVEIQLKSDSDRKHFKSKAERGQTPSGFACGKAIRRSFFEKLQFPPGFWYEDTIMRFLILPQSRKSVVLPDELYFYRENESGITHQTQFSNKCADTWWVTDLVDREHEQLNLPDDQDYIDCLIEQFKMNYFRTVNAPDRVKEAIFVLSSELIRKRYRPAIHRQDRLIQSLLSMDYGKYCLYLKIDR